MVSKELLMDSHKKTRNHVDIVGLFMTHLATQVLKRSREHDASKFQHPEEEIFAEYTPALKDIEYGSEEYNDCLKKMKPALDHHYANNSHHPEYNINGVDGMNILDILEMICDWKASSMRHDDGDIRKSIEINKNRFDMSDQLCNILNNTVDMLDDYFDYDSIKVLK